MSTTIRLITKGKCKHKCKDFPENRGERMSKFPGLAKLQKKCKECGYWCYKEELGLKCPCCNLQFGRGEGRRNRITIGL